METTNKLEFEVAEWDNPLNTDGWSVFRVGTVNGQWRATDKSYQILSVLNDSPGNGHLNDLFEWFEASCKRDGKALEVLEVWNKDFGRHLAAKRGFTYAEGDNMVKIFK